MALDRIQRELRREAIGSSDVAALLGMHPYRTAGDVWAEKTGRLPAEADDDAGPAADLGSLLEDGVIRWAERELGPITRDRYFKHPILPAACNADGIAPLAKPRPVGIEAKTSGLIFRPQYFEDFGDAGTDQVPQHIALQCHHQMLVYKAQGDATIGAIREVQLPCLLVGRGLVMFRVAFNKEIHDLLWETITEFWDMYVTKNVCPPDLPSLTTLTRIKRIVTPEPVPLPDDLVLAFVDANQARLAAEKVEAEAKRELIAALGDAEHGLSPAGIGVTFKDQHRKETVQAATTFRVLRTQKPKKEKTK